MDNLSCFGVGEGGYIFISHSHEDIKQVRKIRNEMEENGFEPLCFYLKCLTDDDEVEGLIKREIDAREWFVYIDSPNARKSKWVQKERRYIESIGNKKVLTIDLEREQVTKYTADRIMSSMRVFFSYAYKDKGIAGILVKALRDKDLRVFDGRDMPWGADWANLIANQIIESSNYGCVPVLISENTIHSEYVIDEIYFAAQNKASILPVLIGDIELPSKLKLMLSRFRWVRIDSNPTDAQIEKVVEATEQILLDKFNSST